jgi:hypothetical protein
VLLNSTFQWFWVAAAALPVIVHFRGNWRTVVTVAVLPLLLVAVWYVKNDVLFQASTTSTSFGFNLARITTSKAGPGELGHLLKTGEVSSLSGHELFAPLKAYGGEFSPHAPTGIAVLDAPTKRDGQPNLNNINYIEISNRFLHDDLVFIKTYPGTYARNVGKATMLFFVPPEQEQLLGANAVHMSSYLRWYDLLVEWQPHGTDISQINTLAVEGFFPSIGGLSFGAIALFSITLFVLPVIAWRRRGRRDATLLLTLTFIWVSTVYVFVLTTFVELGENERFRYSLGPLPLVATAAVVVVLLRGNSGAHARNHGELMNENSSRARSMVPSLASGKVGAPVDI